MTKRVVRGGGWYDFPRSPRSAFRSRSSADDTEDDRGFRLLQEDANGSYLVMRGGSWSSSSIYACCAYRHTGLQSGYIGFRLVQEAQDG